MPGVVKNYINNTIHLLKSINIRADTRYCRNLLLHVEKIADCAATQPSLSSVATVS